jgi:hypothetical protein
MKSSFHWTITPCSRVLLENLRVAQVVKKLPVFYGTRRFIAVFTRPRYETLS